MNRDSGAIVLGWLTKLVVAFALIGVVAYDAVSLAVAHVHASDQAGELARQAADSYQTSKDVNSAYLQASAAAAAEGDTILPTDFLVMPGGQVQLTLRHTATSLWMVRVGSLKKYLDITAQGEGAPFS
ncbi:MAG: hypothetical protein JWN55_1599 [Frankiales bacterium]|nr:hypothetical protein [Frankiales bacterium]